MNPTQLMEAAKLVGKFQKDPEALKDYIPVIENIMLAIVNTGISAHPDCHHFAYMIDARSGRICLHITDVDQEGKIYVREKQWLSDFLNSIILKNVPEVIQRLREGQPWDQVRQLAIKPKNPVTTLEDHLMDMADEKTMSSVFEKTIRPKLSREYDSGHCQTLLKLLMEHFDESDTHTLMCWLKLDARWSEKWYKELVWALWNSDQKVIDQIEQIWETNNKEPLRDE